MINRSSEINTAKIKDIAKKLIFFCKKKKHILLLTLLTREKC